MTENNNNKNKHRILFVDDEESLLALLSAEMVDAGYEVETAGDGHEALIILQQRHFDVILLDVNMPKISGMQVLQFVTESYPKSKVIMLTALDDIGTALEAKRYGAYDFVTKPYILEDLLLKIQEAVSNTSPQ